MISRTICKEIRFNTTFQRLLSRGVFEERTHNNELCIIITVLLVKDLYQDEYDAVLYDICEALRKSGYDKETIEKYIVDFSRNRTRNYLNVFNETDIDYCS